MAMTPGSVSIAADGTETKSGFAEDYYDALKTEWEAALAAFNQPVPTDLAIIVPARKTWAKAANRAASIIQYIIDNGQAKIATTDSALQRTPNPNNADTATQGPSIDKFLAIV